MSLETLIPIGTAVSLFFWAIYWYYCPMTMDEIRQAVEQADRKLHIKSFISYTRLGTPTRLDLAVFLGWVILTKRPRGRIVDVMSGPHLRDFRKHKSDPEEWFMGVYFWSPSYPGIPENGMLPTDMIVEV